MLTVTAQLSRLMSSQCVHSVDSCMVRGGRVAVGCYWGGRGVGAWSETMVGGGLA